MRTETDSAKSGDCKRTFNVHDTIDAFKRIAFVLCVCRRPNDDIRSYSICSRICQNVESVEILLEIENDIMCAGSCEF